MGEVKFSFSFFCFFCFSPLELIIPRFPFSFKLLHCILVGKMLFPYPSCMFSRFSFFRFCLLQLTVPQIKAEMEKTFRWLVPLALDTTKYVMLISVKNIRHLALKTIPPEIVNLFVIFWFTFCLNFIIYYHHHLSCVPHWKQSTPRIWMGWRVGKCWVSRELSFCMFSSQNINN